MKNLVALLLCLLLFACGAADPREGQAAATGGAAPVTMAGAVGTGGEPSATGGSNSTGGVIETGGSPIAMGGAAPSTGGDVSTGGTAETGGTPSTGGTTSAPTPVGTQTRTGSIPLPAWVDPTVMRALGVQCTSGDQAGTALDIPSGFVGDITVQIPAGCVLSGLSQFSDGGNVYKAPYSGVGPNLVFPADAGLKAGLRAVITVRKYVWSNDPSPTFEYDYTWSFYVQ